MKEIKELNKWREIPCSWMTRLSMVKMSSLHNFIYGFNVISVKIPASYFMLSKIDFRAYMNSPYVLTIANTILTEKNRVGGLALPDF